MRHPWLLDCSSSRWIKNPWILINSSSRWLKYPRLTPFSIYPRLEFPPLACANFSFHNYNLLAGTYFTAFTHRFGAFTHISTPMFNEFSAISHTFTAITHTLTLNQHPLCRFGRIGADLSCFAICPNVKYLPNTRSHRPAPTNTTIMLWFALRNFFSMN